MWVPSFAGPGGQSHEELYCAVVPCGWWRGAALLQGILLFQEPDVSPDSPLVHSHAAQKPLNGYLWSFSAGFLVHPFKQFPLGWVSLGAPD